MSTTVKRLDLFANTNTLQALEKILQAHDANERSRSKLEGKDLVGIIVDVPSENVRCLCIALRNHDDLYALNKPGLDRRFPK